MDLIKSFFATLGLFVLFAAMVIGGLWLFTFHPLILLIILVVGIFCLVWFNIYDSL